MKSAITPVSIFPSTANVLEVDDSWANTLGGAPRFNYRLNNVISGTPATTNPDGTTTPATLDIVTTLKEGTVNMTADQWDNWAIGTSNDESYILSCVAQNLGLSLLAS